MVTLWRIETKKNSWSQDWVDLYYESKEKAEYERTQRWHTKPEVYDCECTEEEANDKLVTTRVFERYGW